MAERTITIRTDDVTGKDGDDIETVRIVIGRDAYDVDMSAKTYEAFRAAVEPYVSKGVKAGKVPAANVIRPAFPRETRTAAAVPSTSKEQRQAVRDWWTKNVGREGIPPVSERGRIPTVVLTKFSKYAGRPIPEAEKPAVKAAPAKAAPAVSFKPEIPAHHPSQTGRVGGVATRQRGTRVTAAAPKPRSGASTTRVTAEAAPKVRKGRAKS